MPLYTPRMLTHKLTLLVILVVLLALAVLGVYFDLFLKSNYLEGTQKRMLHGYQRLAYNLHNIERELQQGLAFLKYEDTVLASIQLINKYQDKQNYQAILFDEEKKSIAAELLHRVKLSFNNEIALYDKNGELLAYASKENQGYRLWFISYRDDAQAVMYCRLENEDFFNPCTYQPNANILLKHYPSIDTESGNQDNYISYDIVDNELVVKAHQSLLDKQGDLIAHVELSKIIGIGYFAKFSQELDVGFQLSPVASTQAGYLFNDKVSELDIKQTDSAYVGNVFVNTRNGPLYIRATLHKQQLNEALEINRRQLLYLLLLVALVVLLMMRVILQRGLAAPLQTLMRQIDAVESGNYTPSHQVVTGDELEQVSRNINQLAAAVEEREISLKESQRVLEYLSNHDSLTELPNRRFFYARLEKALHHAEHAGHRVALLFLDLDQFKQINDTLGHHVGDELLRHVSKRLLASLDNIEQLARIGGDEFNILLDNFTHQYDVQQLAQRTLNVFDTPFTCFGTQIRTSASIGIALYPEHGEDVMSLVKYADLAMYQSKDNGRNSFQFFSNDMAIKLKERMEMSQALKDALQDGDQFELLYQPKYCLHTHRFTGLEALIRWHHPHYGYVEPDRFIPLAEETDLIIDIGYWVMQKACEDFVHLHTQGLGFEHISVNVSSIQLQHGNMIESVAQVIRATGIQATQLELEITESYIATDVKNALETLGLLRQMGIKLAIDDFGTGYSSMSYLKQLPVTRLKIDKSFVDALPYKKADVQIVKTIIELAKSFNLAVTAEGVENAAQADFLKTLPCDEIQGYFYARPLPLKALPELWRSQQQPPQLARIN